MARMEPCGKCGGSGHIPFYNRIQGGVCFACNGKGKRPYRKPTVAKVKERPATRTIASICGGDPTKLDPNNERALDYLGLTKADLAHYCELWRDGVREVPNEAPKSNPGLPLASLAL